MRLCDNWYRDHQKLPTLPTQEDIKAFDQVLKIHLAACETCQEEVKRCEKIDDRAGQMPIALLAIIGDSAQQAAEGKPFEMTREDYAYLVLKVAQDWKIITWNEPMLQLREDWARRVAGD